MSCFIASFRALPVTTVLLGVLFLQWLVILAVLFSRVCDNIRILVSKSAPHVLPVGGGGVPDASPVDNTAWSAISGLLPALSSAILSAIESRLCKGVLTIDL